ncbi:MAG TPA: hypothetical protein VND93_06205 [Myxococcales bacterium]|nr:hypothetical protein [Myxococcales bacterium]
MADPGRPPLPRALTAVVVALYVLAFPYHPRLRSPNELCRLWQARAMVEFGTLSVNRALQAFGPVGDLSVKDGKLYPSKAPLLSFAAVPIYAALKALGGGHLYAVPELAQVYWSRFFLTVLPTLGMLLLLRRFLGTYVAQPLADAVTATYALGTLAFSYSLLFMSHQSTAVLLVAAFYALWRCGRGEWRFRGYLLAGLASGAAVAAEYTAGLGVLALVLYGALTWALRADLAPREKWMRVARALGLAILGALPPIAALMAYHTACFGHPFETGYVNLNDPGYQGWHLGGFLGIRTPDPRAFALSFFSPLRGLFTLSPVLLVALPGLVRLRRAGSDPERRALFWLAVALLGGYAYFTSSFSYESWGWTTGPRHMTGLVPFLLLPIALFIESAPELWSAAAVGLAASSVLVTGALTLVNYFPDNVSNALFGLAVPLFADGFLPPALLGAVLPNPLAGALLLAAVAAAAGMILLALAKAPRARAVAAAVALAHVGLLAALPHHSEGDVGATKFLESVWLAPPGQYVHLWPGG